jgi:hypothetical protein
VDAVAAGFLVHHGVRRAELLDMSLMEIMDILELEEALASERRSS